MPTPIARRLDRNLPSELRAKLDAAHSRDEMVGERRIVTMLFCDVQGSTAAAESLDPEEWTDIINGAFEYMIKPVYEYEGTVARLMGDGILAFFGAPIAHEDDPLRAVLAGLDIVDGISAYRQGISQRWGLDLNVRVGINTGLVVVGAVGSDLRMEYTALGDAINLAARMEQTAQPGTVQIAYDTYRIVKSYFVVEDLGGITVKGKTGPVRAYRVTGRKSVARRQRGIEDLQSTLVGRDHELSVLQNIFQNASEGLGHIVSVVGRAGLGKSRLIHEARRELGRDSSLDWIETASLTYEGNRPYAPFQRLIRRLNHISPGDSATQVRAKLAKLRDEFDESVSSRAQRVFEALFDLDKDGETRLQGEAFKEELYAIMPAYLRQRFSQHPTILVFDDVHWSDPASVELLLHLFPLTAEIPMVLVCSFRPERDQPVWSIKRTALEEFHHHYTEIVLQPLPDPQVDALIDGLLAGSSELPLNLRERILERAGGNPFFVGEVIRSLIDNQVLVAEEIIQEDQPKLLWRAQKNGRGIDIPDNLHALLSARIDRLEVNTRHLLQTAAVIGRSFYRSVLEAIMAQGREAIPEIEPQLTTLLHQEMIREVARLPEIEYRFGNPLTQEVAYQTILLKRRRELHLRVGHALEALFPDELGELAPQLAHHFSEGHLPHKAFHYHLIAGDSAARLFANVEALDHYTRALLFVDNADPGHDELQAVYSGRGRALELLARYEESLQNYEAMLQQAQARHDRRLELAAKMAQATIRSIPSRVFDADLSLHLSEEARNLAHALGDSSAEAKIAWNLMLHHMWAGFDFEQAVKYGEAAANAARKSNQNVEKGPILNDLALAYFAVGHLDSSLQTFEESRKLLRDANDLPLLALNLTNASTVQFLVGNSASAKRMMEEAERINRTIKNNWGLAGCTYYRGSMHLITGRWGEALTALTEAIHFCEIAQAEMLLAASLLAKASYYLYVGNVERGLSLARQSVKLFETDMPVLKGYPWGIMSRLFLVAGDQPSAREALRKSLDNLNLDLPPTPSFSSIEVRLAVIELQLDDHRPDFATETADKLLLYLQRFHVQHFRCDALLLKAKALLNLNRPGEANEILREACRQAEELSALPALWRILDFQADTLEQLGDPVQAISNRERARDILATLADSIMKEEDRATFLNLPPVRQLRQDDE